MITARYLVANVQEAFSQFVADLLVLNLSAWAEKSSMDRVDLVAQKYGRRSKI